MTAPIKWFVLAYARSRGALVGLHACGPSMDVGKAALKEHEEAYRADPDVEVVLFASRSLRELTQTHSRYFMGDGLLATTIREHVAGGGR